MKVHMLTKKTPWYAKGILVPVIGITLGIIVFSFLAAQAIQGTLAMRPISVNSMDAIYASCLKDHPEFDCRVFMATGKFP